MKIKASFLAMTIGLLFFGGIALTMALDLWSTTADKTPVTYKEGAFKGVYNPSDIRGSYTFEKIADLFDIEEKVLFEAFVIPIDTDASLFKSKDIEGRYEGLSVEIGNESMQVFVALYKGLPIVYEDSYLPQEAVNLILRQNENLSPDEIQYLSDHKVAVSSENPPVAGSTESGVETKTGEPLINGSSTFQQVLDLGITRSEVEAIIGGEIEATHETVKDYCSSRELPFSTVKEKLLSLLSE